ncbi:MAG: outer membrane protein assembly factor BamA [Nitrospirae bacterium]|nr:outer membrane protein assembly factor BamA [Nitrospirota bacterium]
MTGIKAFAKKTSGIGILLTALFLLISSLSACISDVSAEDGPIINALEIRGTRRVDSETAAVRIKSRTGEPFSKITVQEDIKRLYAFGYFDDISVEIEPFEGGVRLIFIITEKPLINSVDFQGNEEYEAKDLREKIAINAGAIASLPLISDNAEKLVSYYQSEGYWLVSVLPVIREVSKDSVALTYQITEGPKVVIKDIIIEGNKAVSRREIMKAMKTKERGLFSFITGSGIYQRDQIRADLENIKEVYQNKGFLYAAVSEPELSLSPDRKKLSLKISVSEGDQYKIGGLRLSGNKAFPDDRIYKDLKIVSGQIFDRSALRADIDRVLDLYMDNGYAQADINPLIDINTGDKVANITLSVTEGEIFRVGRIDVSGNTKTRDKVVRREMRLDEGDVFSRKLLKRSYQRLGNLNYFETVDISPSPRIKEKLMDLDVKIKEKMTGMLSVGGGYSSVDKFMVMGEVTQGNLFGKGYALKLKADLSSRRTNYNISLRDPWFMDKPLSATVGLFRETFEYPDYDKKSAGGLIGLGKEFTEYVSGNVTYNLESVEITDVSDSASTLIKEQVGKKLTSSISPSISMDTRDSYLDPTSGYRHALYTTFAGLGGDNYFAKGLVDSVWYFPFKWRTTFDVRGRLGYADGFAGRELPLYERFCVGGISTIRGIGFCEAGPIDEQGEKIGGNYEMIFNTEYIFPIIDDIHLKGVVFFDYGSAFDKNEKFSMDKMRQTAGFGFRWMSPFGPLRLEMGFNLDPKENEDSSKLEFSIGGFF